MSRKFFSIVENSLTQYASKEGITTFINMLILIKCFNDWVIKYYFGKISGWGDNRFYENIPNDFDNSSLKTMIYKELHNTIKTKYELINYLNNYPYKELLKHELKNIKLSCMPISFKQVPMIDRWKNDNVF